MQFTLSALVAAAFVTSAIAGGSECSTGPIQCCDSVQEAGEPSTAALLGLLGVVVQDVHALVGVTCTPISVIGVGGSSCSGQTVCCENNNFQGVVAVGCTPINL